MNLLNIHFHIIVIVGFLIVFVFSYSTGQLSQIQTGKEEDKDEKMAFQGNLYDVFKKRLEQFCTELDINIGELNDASGQLANFRRDNQTSFGRNRKDEYHPQPEKFDNVIVVSEEGGPKKESRPTKIQKNVSRFAVSDAKTKRSSDDGCGNIFDRNDRSKLKELSKKDFTSFKRKWKSKQTTSRPAIGLGNEINGKTSNSKEIKKIENSNKEFENRIKLLKYPPLGTELWKFPLLNKLKSPRIENFTVVPTKDRQGQGSNFYQMDQNSRFPQLQQAILCRRAVEVKNPVNGFKNNDDILQYGMGINTDAYPNVLTKAIESNLKSPIGGAPDNILISVAEKMNTTPIELAKKLAHINDLGLDKIKSDPKLNQIVQKYITSTVAADANERQTKQLKNDDSSSTSTSTPKTTADPTCSPCPIQTTAGEESSSCDISAILEKVLCKLDRLQVEKDEEDGKMCSTPDGAPCDVLGSWNSHITGLRFDISMNNPIERELSEVERNNKLLNIATQEVTPRRRHEYIDCDWEFMGSAVKQLGGPFYMYTQKPCSPDMATFIGFCRTCSGIDTIFGSWTFIAPSKDCQDIMTSIHTRRDILRRYRMEEKCRERMKDLLYVHEKNKKKN